jgi:uracil-DNA glycosylase family 4
MSRIGSRRVPGEGDPNSPVWLVGEAPGKDEEIQQRPFVGRSGQFLERYLGRLDLKREDVYLTNLCKYRPYKNKFANLTDSEELQIGLEELRQGINEHVPNTVIALGSQPLKYLTGETSIFRWRGSFLPCTHAPVTKVLPTFHPAYVVRPQGFKWHPVFFNDLRKAFEHSSSPDLPYPQYESLIDPPYHQVEPIVEEMYEAEWLAIDIETFPGGQLSCIGFSDGPSRGLCFTFENIRLWPLAKELLVSPAKKCFQYGNYDINFLDRFYEWPVTNYAWDTFIASSHLLPEFPRGLDFLTSIHTTFPYYKEERKEWKQESDMTSLWKYNIKDCIATFLIMQSQQKEMKELYG